jgi:hypothetical protein
MRDYKIFRTVFGTSKSEARGRVTPLRAVTAVTRTMPITSA